MDGMGSMRDLDQIREREDGRDPARTVVLAVSGLAAACVLFAAGILIGRDHDSPRHARVEDPLARLDALAAQTARAPAPEVTYPTHLGERRAEPGAPPAAGANPSLDARMTAGSSPTPASPSAVVISPLARPGSSGPSLAPPPPAPLAAATPGAPALPLRPAPLAATARSESRPAASPGTDGAFNLQVSSFRTAASAQAFAQRLRERGHHAFVASTTATTPTGRWHRVRVGPFSSLREVSQYRTSFEARERLPTFVVRRDPASAAH